MYKLNHFQKSQHKAFLLTIISVSAVISVMVLFLGISGIVEHKSPQNMASLMTLGFSFVDYFEYHLLIIAGALGFTSAAWFFSQQ